MRRSFLTVLLLLPLFTNLSFAQCNGYEPLCEKKYDEVAYLTTHNAYNNTEMGFDFTNHHYSITQQLNAGVRALMIDVYDLDGVPTVYHGLSLFGTQPLTANLTEIKNFLDTNPNEVVTIIFECYVTANQIEGALTTVDLMPYLFEKGSDDWPTLQQMIDDENRLVIFTDSEDASADQGWFHHVWTHAVETPFTYYNVDEFDCEFNRGDPDNDLFILNHFVTDESLGIGVESQAEIANANPFFIDRCDECETITGKFPNFPTIDFYSIGDGLAVVNALNDLGDLGLETNATIDLKVWPNPANNQINLFLDKFEAGLNWKYELYDLRGTLVLSDHIDQAQTIINTDQLKNGIYTLSISSAQSHLNHQKLCIQK